MDVAVFRARRAPLQSRRLAHCPTSRRNSYFGGLGCEASRIICLDNGGGGGGGKVPPKCPARQCSNRSRSLVAQRSAQRVLKMAARRPSGRNDSTASDSLEGRQAMAIDTIISLNRAFTCGSNIANRELNPSERVRRLPKRRSGGNNRRRQNDKTVHHLFFVSQNK